MANKDELVDYDLERYLRAGSQDDIDARFSKHSSASLQGVDFAFSKDRQIMTKRKSFMESLFELKHTDLMNGDLQKLSSQNQYQQRWFVIHGHYLSYFKKHIDTSQHFDMIPKPDGTINLWHVSDVSLDETKITLKLDHVARSYNRRSSIANSFRLRTPTIASFRARRGDGSNTYVLKASDTAYAEKWVAAIKNVPLQYEADMDSDGEGLRGRESHSDSKDGSNQPYVIHSIRAGVGSNGALETVVPSAHQYLAGGALTKLFLPKVVPGTLIHVNVALGDNVNDIVGYSQFFFPDQNSSPRRRNSALKRTKQSCGQLALKVKPSSDTYKYLSDCVLVIDWAEVDSRAKREIALERQNSEAQPHSPTMGLADKQSADVPRKQSRIKILGLIVFQAIVLCVVYVSLLTTGKTVVELYDLQQVVGEVHVIVLSFFICWAMGLVSPFVVFGSDWHSKDSKQDSHGRFMFRRAFVVEKKFQAKNSTPANRFAAAAAANGVHHAPGSIRVRTRSQEVVDVSITEFEKEMVDELRRRLSDLYTTSEPVSPSSQFSNFHQKQKGNKGKQGASKPLYVPQLFLNLAADPSEFRRKVCAKHLDVDYRLVRYLRASGMDVDKAQRLVRRAMQWRCSFTADSIVSDFTPPEWLLRYMAPPELLELLQNKEDRRKWYLRDEDGHLAMVIRSGPIDWMAIYEKLDRNDDMLLLLGIWVLELIRQDLDKLHEETDGEIASYITLVFDLSGYSQKYQIARRKALRIAKKFFDIIATAYPELLHRVVIVNAPKLFFLWWRSALKPLLPKSMVEKISLHLHDNDKILSQLLSVCTTDSIPAYLGGLLVVNGDKYCSEKLPPAGPWMEDSGQHLL